MLDAWAQRFSARDPESRRAVLGELMDQHSGYATGRLLLHDRQVAILAPGKPPTKCLVWPDLACDCGCEQQAQFPPVSLPDPAILAKQVAADGADLLRRLVALASGSAAWNMPALPIRWWKLADERNLQVTALRHDPLVRMP